jgi:hypothetical protein
VELMTRGPFLVAFIGALLTPYAVVAWKQREV